MSSDHAIRTALNRAREAIELRPSMAEGTMSVHLKLDEGIKCVTQSDKWRTEIDEPTSIGGGDTAPTPGIYGLSALASCFAMSIKMLAVQSGITIERIEIDVKGDFDDRAFFDIGAAAPGYQDIRMKIEVQSDAPDDRIRSLVAEARAKSTWFNIIANANPIATNVQTVAGAS